MTNPYDEPEVDEFDLPVMLFGTQPEWFFPAVGRVVAVSALLENKAQVLAETLAGCPQDTLSMARIADLRKNALQAADQIDMANSSSGVEPVKPEVTDFFDRTARLLDRRNDVVHAIWPAQPGAEQFGWRSPRPSKTTSVRVTADNTRAKLSDLIRQESELILAWNRLHGAATHARVQAATQGYAGLPAH